MPPTHAGPAAWPKAQRRRQPRLSRQPRAARRTLRAAQGASTRKPACRRQPTQPRTPIGWAATIGPETRCAAPWLNDLPPAPARQPREPRVNRRPGHRRRPGARPREGRRLSTGLTPRPPSNNSARRLRGPDGDLTRWGFAPPDSRRASRTLSNPARRRTQPVAGPSRLDTPKCAGRHTGTKRPPFRAS